MVGRQAIAVVLLAALGAGAIGCTDEEPETGAIWTPPTPESMMNTRGLEAMDGRERPAWDVLGLTSPKSLSATDGKSTGGSVASWKWGTPNLHNNPSLNEYSVPIYRGGGPKPKTTWWDDVVADMEDIFGVRKDPPNKLPTVLPPESSDPEKP